TLTNGRIYVGTVSYETFSTFDAASIPNGVAAAILSSTLDFAIAALQPGAATAAPPVITSPPTNQTRAAAARAILAANILGNNAYQWFKDGAEINTANTAKFTVSQPVGAVTLAINNLTPDDAGNYYMRVFNSGGFVYSPPINLAVQGGAGSPTIT